MNLTYEVDGAKYTIFNNGKAWIVQDGFYPYQGATVEESAQNHIDAILAEQSVQATDPLDDVRLALAELAEQQELDKLNTQLALAELAETIMAGGAE